VSGNNVNQMLEEQKSILSKLNLEQDGEMNELSKVLNAMVSNIYNQLEQALKEKAEVEVEKRIIEEKLQNVLSKDKK
jgi:nitrogen fixation/metabolism regulation signal transduction histidine kinase